MNPGITIRQATSSDSSFLAETIIAAEKSGTDKLSYTNIFGIPEPAFLAVLHEILEEDIEGQELCVSGFLIAQEGKEYAAASCSWIEGQTGKSSALLRAGVLYYYLGKERIDIAMNKYPFLSEINVDREEGSLQIESVYTRTGYRGRGITPQLIAAHIRRGLEAEPALKKVQIIVAKTNDSALKSYHKLGFETVLEKKGNHPQLIQLLPSNTRVLLENDIHNLKKYL